MNDILNSKFESYYIKHYNQLLKYIVRRIGNSVPAEDIVMDVFTSCYQNFEDFDPERSSFITWAYVITNNKLKNYYRDNKVCGELDENLPCVDKFEDEVLQAQYLEKMRDALSRAIDDLNETQRELVIYKYFQGKNSTEISELTGLTPTNVRVNLSRAMQKMKRYFDENNIQWEY